MKQSQLLVQFIFLSLMVTSTVSVYGASGESLLWDTYLLKIASNLQGVAGPALAIIGIVATGATWFLFRNQGIGEKAVPLVVGLSLVLAASQWVDIGNFSSATVGSITENPAVSVEVQLEAAE